MNIYKKSILNTILFFSIVGFNSNKLYAQLYASIPYSTGFESGSLDASWTWNGTEPTAEVKVFATNTLIWNNIAVLSHTGTYFLGSHNTTTAGNFNTNEAKLHLDMNGISNAKIKFWWSDWDDENHPEDAVFISDNGGTTYTKIFDHDPQSYTSLVWHYFEWDLDSINTKHGLTYSSNYIIKFQQHDNFFLAGGNDGFIYDDIEVYQTCFPEQQIVKACDSVKSPSGNYTWNTSGVFNDTIDPKLACLDSAITVDLTILNSTSSLNLIEACLYYFSSIDNQIIKKSIIDTIYIVNKAGCDSLIIRDITIHIPVKIIDSIDACGKYTWPVNGETYYDNTDYSITKGGALNCDTTYTLVLSIKVADSLFEDLTVCNSYYWSETRMTYETTGSFVYNYLNENECPSTSTINLTVVPLDDRVIYTPNLLTVQESGIDYQWLDCNNGYAQISNGNIQSLSVKINDNVAVELKKEGCIDTTSCHAFFLGIDDNNDLNQIKVFPNPNRGDIYVDLGNVKTVSITVFDITGAIVYIENNISQTNHYLNFTPVTGTYIIQINYNDIIERQRLVVE